MYQKLKAAVVTMLLSLPACSTLDESVKLGASMGSITGIAATHAAYNDTGMKPDSDTVTTGAAIGLALGVLTSYITHKEVDKDRYKPSDDPNTFFGDLPPNPFITNNN